MITLTRGTDKYPALLQMLQDSPETLYIEGEILPVDIRAVAVVGTRTPTTYGISATQYFVRELVKSGVTIVSGLARGIDTIAHTEAIKHGGRTLAVLAGGLDHLYPPENKKLAKEITSQGALISPFESEIKPQAEYFLARNRIIAGLSLVVLVIEGKARSGTISTANHAADLGREVFALPGPINAPFSQAPNMLIANGATIALNPQSIRTYIENL